MERAYLEQLEAHIDKGGKLSHQNALELLQEVKRLREELCMFPVYGSTDFMKMYIRAALKEVQTGKQTATA